MFLLMLGAALVVGLVIVPSRQWPVYWLLVGLAMLGYYGAI